MSRRAEQLDPSGQVLSNLISSTLMRSGEDRNFFRWPKPIGNDPALAQWHALDKIRFQLRPSACYCSMFDECWITTFDSGVPRPVQRCAAAASPERDAPS